MVSRSMRKTVALACLTLWVLTACTSLPAPMAQSSSGGAQPFQLTVVHSNDTWGYLQPCG